MRSTHHPSARTLALRALPLLLAAACASQGAPVPDNGGGVSGRPQAVVCGRGNGQFDAKPIGAGGGTLVAYRHELFVPKDAVGARTTLTIMEVASTSIRVELGPDGTTFEKPATLTLSFARCGGMPRGFRDLQILQVDGNDSVIAALPSTVDVGRRTVSAPLQHLSGYLIGGNRDGT
ncbi:MAG TPA: hypothetical protein VFT45_23135 [Longimicrobium sp.]|nr:hypothetical protein [Longimicrobium sp.]